MWADQYYFTLIPSGQRASNDDWATASWQRQEAFLRLTEHPAQQDQNSCEVLANECSLTKGSMSAMQEWQQ